MKRSDSFSPGFALLARQELEDLSGMNPDSVTVSLSA